MPTESSQTVFLVDDDGDLRRLLAAWLKHAGYDVREFDTGEACMDGLARMMPAAVLMDLNMPGQGGVPTLELLKARHRFLPVVVLTVEREVETVVSTMQRGAYDFLTKPITKNKLLMTVQNAIAQHQMAVRLAELEREVSGGLPGIVGVSPGIKEVNRQIERLAASDVSVYIHGESGTGKELVAHAIHDNSGRREGPFVAINCAAIPESIQESELFGHERGSFTGASQKRVGRFEQAHGGTLFLDEVAELSLSTQSKLLRVLQERRLLRVGGTQELAVDFRLLVATHKNLLEEVRAGRFREDLYFRIVVFELEIPPLRERQSDIPLLVLHFAERYAPKMGVPVPTIGDDAMQLLLNYGWPGNIRELENAIQRAMVSCGGREVVAVDLPPTVRLSVAHEPIQSPHVFAGRAGTKDAPTPMPAPVHMNDAPASGRIFAAAQAHNTPLRAPELTNAPIAHGFGGMTLAEVERQVIQEALARCEGNRSLVAQQLGIGRTTLYRKLKEYGL